MAEFSESSNPWPLFDHRAGRVAVCLGLLCFGIGAACLSGMLRIRWAVLAAGTLLALSALCARRSLRAGDWCLAAGVLSSTAFIAAGATALLPGAQSEYEYGKQLVLVLLGWSFILPWLAVRGGSSMLRWLAASRTLPFLITAAVVEFTAIHWLLRRASYVMIIDEALYRLQALSMRSSPWHLQISPQLADFFLIRLSYLRDGYIHSQYPPGWPIVLSLFHFVHATAVAPVLLGCVAVTAIYRLGMEYGGRTVAALSVLILLPNYYFVYAGATYLSHTLCLSLVTAAGWLLLRADRFRGRVQHAHVAGAGFLIGCAVAVRPATGAAIGVSLFLWNLLRRRSDPRRVVLVILIGLAGAAVPVVAVLPLNYSYSGSYSLVAGYNLAGRGLVDLGFGLRGYLNYHPDGITRVLAEPFTPRSAVQHTAALFGEAMEVATPFALIGPLAFLWLRRCGGRAWALRHVLPFLALPALQSFYFSKDLRYYTELLPFLAVAIAAILSGLLERVPRMCTPLLLLLMAGGALTSGLRLRNDALVFERDALPAFHAVEALVRQNPRVLLFVRDERPQMFERLLWFSVEAGSDHIVVARDLGARNEDLIRLYPAYAIFHIAENGVFTSLR